MKTDLGSLINEDNITFIVKMDNDEHFLKQLKTPAQIWYYLNVYPEEVTITHAEVMYRERETTYEDDGYFEAVFRLVYGHKWEDSKLKKTVNKIMEAYYSEQK